MQQSLNIHTIYSLELSLTSSTAYHLFMYTDLHYVVIIVTDITMLMVL